ncbi:MULTISPECIES: hypothetical protein [unclassified Ruegeria]|uniref:hypothetical protein n=1 Tax=unclassified Ruegeria TaxID=2625375 RepID=UPI001AD97AB8|nr:MULTISPECIES: hypothetical protein [unclassified Ruegeria]MBO9411303.1 hypothetical protein [Ruegeria sp. R8_1]MBO9415504.1 hypothetical protein [Ruegeria sp. R8_2]
MQSVDIALVGAGPAAYAALTAMRGFSGSVAVVTGATSKPSQGGPVKIVSVAYERQQPACLADRTEVSGDAPPMFAAAEVGGLANYWGKQLQVYDCDDPWGRGQFLETWWDYCAACEAVQRDLKVVGGARHELLENGLEKSVPRLLNGTSETPNAGLRTMARAVEARLKEMPNVSVRAGRVSRILSGQGMVRLDLDDGTQLRARHVFLASGVLGTANLLARSLPQASQIGFRDHAPYIMNCLWLSRALGSPRAYAEAGHFNALTLKHKVGGRCDLFASVYAVSQAPISLITATFGLGPHLRGRRIGRLVDFVQPIRIWTPTTMVQLRHLPREGRIEANKVPDADQDIGLRNLLDWLASHGVRHTLGVTAPGQGFHYHKLTVGDRDEPVDQVVESAFDGRVRVIDASCLQEIGCPPHTLTAMAQAYGRVSQDLAMVDLMKEAM